MKQGPGETYGDCEMNEMMLVPTTVKNSTNDLSFVFLSERIFNKHNILKYEKRGWFIV